MHSEYHNSLENPQGQKKKNDKKTRKDAMVINPYQQPWLITHTHTHQHTFHHEFCIIKKGNRKGGKQRKQRVIEKEEKTISSESPPVLDLNSYPGYP